MRTLIPLLSLISSSIAVAAVCTNANADLFSATGTSVASGDTTGQTDDFDPSCQTRDSVDFAYEWVAPSTGTYIIDTEGSVGLADTVLAVYAADCTTEVACDDDDGTGTLSALSIDATAGQRFLIVVDGYNNAVGTYNLNISLIVPVTCSTDFDLGSASPASATGNNCGAADDFADVSCSNTTASGDLAYSWTAPTSGTYTFDTSAGSTFDTVLTVREVSDCATELACDDDSGTDTASTITIDVVAGTEYAIVVDGFYSSATATAACGDFTLDIFAGCPDADGDAVCNADDLCDGDDASGDSDFDFICDDTDFTLTVGQPRRGQPLQMGVANAEPGSNVVFLLGLSGAGAGPCHPTAGICADIRAPRVAGSARANAQGVATFTLPVPPTAPLGAGVVFQAAYIGGAADTSEVESRNVQ